jgi:hypothetical protein
MMRRLAFIFTLATFATTPAFAQQGISLEVIQGSAMVETASQVKKADALTYLQPGDRVLLKSDSGAILSNIENGCFISLRDAGVYTVPAMSDCAAGQASVMSSSSNIVPANGVPAPPAPAVLVAESQTSFAPVAVGFGFATATASAALYSTVILKDKSVVPVVPVSAP